MAVNYALLAALVFSQLILIGGVAVAAPGAVSFLIADRTVERGLDQSEPIAIAADVVIHIEGGGSLPAIGWGVVLQLSPTPGAVGSVRFVPPPIVDSEPNLDPAISSPFADFDRDYGGMSYGTASTSGEELVAVGGYIEPALTSAPILDEFGNLSLPDGSGLFAAPLLISEDARGTFQIEFLERIDLGAGAETTGVAFATGDEPPSDVDVHPIGAYSAATLTISVVSSGDYNGDGLVDAADYTVWRDNLGTTSGATQGMGDGDGDGDVDSSDYLLWRDSYGQASSASRLTPEPACSVLALAVILSSFVVRHRGG